MAGVKGKSGGARKNSGGVREGAGRKEKPQKTIRNNKSLQKWLWEEPEWT